MQSLGMLCTCLMSADEGFEGGEVKLLNPEKDPTVSFLGILKIPLFGSFLPPRLGAVKADAPKSAEETKRQLGSCSQLAA